MTTPATWPGGNQLALDAWNRLNGTFPIPASATPDNPQGLTGYSGLAYDPVVCPYGFENDGHGINLFALCMDFCAVGAQMATFAAQCAAYASATYSQQTAWNPQTPLAAAYVGPNTCTVPGNHVADLLPNGVSGRALLLLIGGLPVNAYVQAAGYDAGTGLTTVTTSARVLTAGLTALQFGQDPNNAPKQQTVDPDEIMFWAGGNA